MALDIYTIIKNAMGEDASRKTNDFPSDYINIASQLGVFDKGKTELQEMEEATAKINLFDNAVNVIDLNRLLSIFAGTFSSSNPELSLDRADFNQDGYINIHDVVGLVNYIL